MDLDKDIIELKSNPNEVQFSEALNIVVKSIPDAWKN